MPAPGEQPPEPWTLWQCNAAAVSVVMRMATQWNADAFGRRIGLRYEALQFALRLERVPRADWPDVVQDVQTIEMELLRLMHQRAERR